VNPVIHPELRYRRLWFVLGLVLAAVVVTLSLLPTRDLPDIKLSDKLEHMLAYVMLAFWFGSLVVRRDYFWLIVALVAFGGLIELVQGWMGLGRQADLHDLAADAIGIAVGMLLAVTPLGRWAHFIEARFRMARA
jgi:VanZ family protein